MMLILYSFLIILYIFVGVVFVTLFERKILGLIQFRYGPNKISLKGFFQSLSDAIKLMSKQDFLFFFSSFIEYNFLPVGMFLFMLTLWLGIPSKLWDYNNGLLLVLCILSVGVYPIMYGAWFSGSLYSMLGSIRSIAQMVSYEVSMIMIIFSLIIFPKTFNFTGFFNEGYIMVFGLFSFLGMLLFISFLVELGRSPVDLLEGESELVSGFNTEYSGFKFALIFLSEYGMIMFMSGLLSSLMLGLSFFSVSWMMFTMLFIMLIVWTRGIMPRIRYDKLMYLCWMIILIMALSILSFNVGYVVSMI
uniref:NADH-ubiquinone oxidoreductase chain 1 n=1 Tax=Wallacidia oculata TaxID=590134 RepID=E0WBP5_9HYME|nr:NADH dehydrogenase subunit 1 [Wallacidia oculata]